MKKYHENMNADEYTEMLKEILTQDEAYAVADKLAADLAKQFPHHPDCPAVDGFACHCDELGDPEAENA